MTAVTRSEARDSEVAWVRGPVRQLTADIIATHTTAAEAADNDNDKKTAKFHRDQIAVLQAPPAGLNPVDWTRFWSRDRSEAFLVEPFLPTGRSSAQPLRGSTHRRRRSRDNRRFLRVLRRPGR